MDIPWGCISVWRPLGNPLSFRVITVAVNMRSSDPELELPAFRSGCIVVTQGMKSGMYNGVLGRLGKHDTECDRWVFRPEGDEEYPIRVRSCNLRWVARPDGIGISKNVYSLYTQYTKTYTNYPNIDFEHIALPASTEFGFGFEDWTYMVERVVTSPSAVNPKDDFYFLLGAAATETQKRPVTILFRRTPASNPLFMTKRMMEDPVTEYNFSKEGHGELLDYVFIANGYQVESAYGKSLNEVVFAKLVRGFLSESKHPGSTLDSDGGGGPDNDSITRFEAHNRDEGENSSVADGDEHTVAIFLDIGL